MFTGCADVPLIIKSVISSRGLSCEKGNDRAAIMEEMWRVERAGQRRCLHVAEWCSERSVGLL